jgi:alpha-amylase/alpha-mannosidase (GH57 family)
MKIPQRMKDGFVVIHGHFYQPPRENPWIEDIEREEGAFPFHDWNERITSECYWPNAYARILDGKGKILRLFNNYSSISFNFGPTLLSWIEKKSPHLYRRILEADREGLRRFGHGNALAQSYDHLILPLANERDRDTEIFWGIADFERRFHRRPEGIWLPEAAVNYPTLQALVRHGLEFIILSPFQARRIRPLGGKKWIDVSQGKIDPTQPYRCFLKRPSGEKIFDQSIDIFFYEGPLSREVSFGDLLKDGKLFCERFREIYQPSKKTPQILHIATDGETYGHHKKFGEMALAYALFEGFNSMGLELTNYGAFRKRFPPLYEVEIDEGPKGEGTSWSCSHGVGRWKEDCGCTTGGKEGWNQKWRRPLREALDFLRDELALLFEREGERIFKDVWEARNHYIEVLFDRSPQQIDAFFEKEGLHPLEESQKIKGLKLLEMERHALRMFTSCGWFFADIGGLETGIILQHAAKAIELAREFSDQRLEQNFLSLLSEAKSNLPELGNGAQIYERVVRTRSVSLEQIIHHFAISSFLNKEGKRVFSFSLEKKKQWRSEEGDSPVLVEEVEVTSIPTSEKERFLYGVLSSRESFFQTWMRRNPDPSLFDQIKKALQGRSRKEEEIADSLSFLLGNHRYTFRDTLKEKRGELLPGIIQKELESSLQMYETCYERNKATLEALIKEGFEIPYELRIAAEITLNHRLLRALKTLSQDFETILAQGEIDQILTEAKQNGYSLHREKVTSILNEWLNKRVEILFENREFDLSNFEGVIQEILTLLTFSERWGFHPSLEEAQGLIGEMLDQWMISVETSLWEGGEPKPFPPLFLTLAEKMNFNIEGFSKMIQPLPSSDS